MFLLGFEKLESIVRFSRWMKQPKRLYPWMITITINLKTYSLPGQAHIYDLINTIFHPQCHLFRPRNLELIKLTFLLVYCFFVSNFLSKRSNSCLRLYSSLGLFFSFYEVVNYYYVYYAEYYNESFGNNRLDYKFLLSALEALFKKLSKHHSKSKFWKVV